MEINNTSNITSTQQWKVYIKENSWVAKLASKKMKSDNCAIVFFNTIYLHNISKQYILNNHALLRHEVMHVHQWKRYGVFLFLYKYIYYSLKYGYHNNPIEVEAREAETNTEILKEIIIM